MNQRKTSAFGRLFTATVDLLLPPRCLATGDIVAHQGTVSPAFWSNLTFIESPYCQTCGLAFGFETPDDTLCIPCMETEPQYTRAKSCVIYNDASRDLLLRFKYGDKLHAVDTFLPWMIRAGKGMIEKTDIIVPVPLHRKRLWKRRYNQSAILATSLARATNKISIPDALLRIRHTVPQKGNRTVRHQNVHNAFAINGRYAHDVRGKNILIVDDVYTSGATLNECARVLKKHGAKHIYVLTLARAMREEDL